MTSITPSQASDGYTMQTVQATQAAQHTLDELTRAAHPDRVFGQPIERGDVTLIPCCEIALGMGMGSGSSQNATSEKTPGATGQGAGGGGGVRGRPVASIVISRGTVTVVPIVDTTKVALAALTTAGFMALWIIRLTSTASRARRIRGASVPDSPRVPSLRQIARGLGR